MDKTFLFTSADVANFKNGDWFTQQTALLMTSNEHRIPFPTCTIRLGLGKEFPNLTLYEGPGPLGEFIEFEYHPDKNMTISGKFRLHVSFSSAKAPLTEIPVMEVSHKKLNTKEYTIKHLDKAYVHQVVLVGLIYFGRLYFNKKVKVIESYRQKYNSKGKLKGKNHKYCSYKIMVIDDIKRVYPSYRPKTSAPRVLEKGCDVGKGRRYYKHPRYVNMRYQWGNVNPYHKGPATEVEKPYVIHDKRDVVTILAIK